MGNYFTQEGPREEQPATCWHPFPTSHALWLQKASHFPFYASRNPHETSFAGPGPVSAERLSGHKPGTPKQRKGEPEIFYAKKALSLSDTFSGPGSNLTTLLRPWIFVGLETTLLSPSALGLPFERTFQWGLSLHGATPKLDDVLQVFLTNAPNKRRWPRKRSFS